MSIISKPFRRLIERDSDESFTSFDELYTKALAYQDSSTARWIPPANLYVTVHQDQLKIKFTGDRAYNLTDWSFSQLCSLLDVDRKVIERLELETAAQVFSEILPKGGEPLQIYVDGSTVRSFHRIRYERLFDADLLDVVLDEAEQLTGKFNERTNRLSFSSGDRDMFAYLVDESSWTHYHGEKFASAFVVWNSEVGARSVGFRSGWYHAGSSGFMLDADNSAISYSRRHSLKVHESLDQIRKRIQLWQFQVDERCESLLRHLSEGNGHSFMKSHENLQRKLMLAGLSKQNAKDVDNWIFANGKKFSHVDVAISVMAVANSLPFAADRFELALASARILRSQSSKEVTVDS